MLEVDGLGREVLQDGKSKWLLRGVDLEINLGDRIGLAGPSGSGKSLLMRAISMLDPIHEGEVRWNGKCVSENSVPEYRRTVCYVPQRMSTLDGTVRETLQFPYSFTSWKRNRYDEEQIVDWLQVLQRDAPFLDKTAREMSGGESQIVRLFLALLASPQVLLLDEPTSAMDEDMALLAENLILNWQRQDISRAFLWVSHSRPQLSRVADRQLRMHGGRLGLH